MEEKKKKFPTLGFFIRQQHHHHHHHLLFFFVGFLFNRFSSSSSPHGQPSFPSASLFLCVLFSSQPDVIPTTLDWKTFCTCVCSNPLEEVTAVNSEAGSLVVAPLTRRPTESRRQTKLKQQ
jgi:hypothetical protein